MADEYERAYVASDPVIFTILDGKLCVLLKAREKAPYKGLYELPGGMLLKKEDPDEALGRKLKALFGTERIYFTQFRTFAAPRRDPRWRVVSIGFIALVPKSISTGGGRWFGVSNLPDTAFDHGTIIREALSYLKDNLNALTAKQFLPREFPLNSLQSVYEVVLGRKFDNRNFRKKMVYDGIVEETGRQLRHTSHRPPKLYRFK